MSEAITTAAMALAVPLVQHYESCNLEPYQNAGDVPTIGWGNTRYEDGRKVTLDDVALTQAEADALLSFYLSQFMTEVQNHIPHALPNELAAFTSLAYNIGIGAFTSSSALRLFLAANKTAAGEHIELWNEADGTVSKGLQRRRKAEHLVFNGMAVSTAIELALAYFP